MRHINRPATAPRDTVTPALVVNALSQQGALRTHRALRGTQTPRCQPQGEIGQQVQTTRVKALTSTLVAMPGVPLSNGGSRLHDLEALTILALLPGTAHLTSKEAAMYIGTTPNVLRVWRSTGRGPRYKGRGHFVRYAKSDLDQFMRGHDHRFDALTSDRRETPISPQKSATLLKEPDAK
jgi:hypothetical protein